MPTRQHYEKAQEIVDEMNYKGWFKVTAEAGEYGAILVLPWTEIDLD